MRPCCSLASCRSRAAGSFPGASFPILHSALRARLREVAPEYWIFLVFRPVRIICKPDWVSAASLAIYPDGNYPMIAQVFRVHLWNLDPTIL
jgi:hypothetical protein